LNLLKGSLGRRPLGWWAGLGILAVVIDREVGKKEVEEEW